MFFFRNTNKTEQTFIVPESVVPCRRYSSMWEYKRLYRNVCSFNTVVYRTVQPRDAYQNTYHQIGAASDKKKKKRTGVSNIPQRSRKNRSAGRVWASLDTSPAVGAKAGIRGTWGGSGTEGTSWTIVVGEWNQRLSECSSALMRSDWDFSTKTIVCASFSFGQTGTAPKAAMGGDSSRSVTLSWLYQYCVSVGKMNYSSSLKM